MPILTEGRFASPQEQATFIDWYTTDFFPRWTMRDFWARQPFKPPPGHSTDFVADLRRELKTAAAAAEKGQREVYDCLTATTLKEMSRLAKSQGKRYHPATRLNATLMIGELNVPEAIPALLGLAGDAKMPEYVRVAAMVGLIRHANPGIRNSDTLGVSEPATIQLSNPAKIEAATAALVAIAQQPAADVNHADGINWLRGQAAEVLGLLGSHGNNGSAVKALVIMLLDAQLPLAQRCRAAYALGRLNYDGVALPAGPCLNALGGLARDAANAYVTGSTSSRRLKGCVTDALAGLRGADDEHTGVGALAKTEAAQAQRQALLKLLAPLPDLIDKSSEEDLRPKVKEFLDAVTPLIKGSYTVRGT